MKTKMTKAMYGKSMMQKGGTARNKKMQNPPKPPMKKGGSVRKMQAGGASEIKDFFPEEGPIKDMEKRKRMAEYFKDPKLARELIRTGQISPTMKLKIKPSSEMQVGKTMKKGGSMKKMQAGGDTSSRKSSPKKSIVDVLKNRKSKQVSSSDRKKKMENPPKPPSSLPVSIPPMKKGGAVKKMKTGGMTNPNSSVSKQTVPGSRGVQSGVNPKASSSKVASSRGSGKANTPPSKAVPTAKRGGMVKKKR